METNDLTKQSSLLADSDPKIHEKNNIYKIRITRKRIEYDSQLLSNRIALLQQEQLKALRKIEETKMKAKKIVLVRISHDDKHILVNHFYHS